MRKEMEMENRIEVYSAVEVEVGWAKDCGEEVGCRMRM